MATALRSTDPPTEPRGSPVASSRPRDGKPGRPHVGAPQDRRMGLTVAVRVLPRAPAVPVAARATYMAPK